MPTLRKRSSLPMQEEKHNLLINKPSDDAGLLLSCRLAAGNGVSEQTLIRLGVNTQGTKSITSPNLIL
jgi:hypothetical protein